MPVTEVIPVNHLVAEGEPDNAAFAPIAYQFHVENLIGEAPVFPPLAISETGVMKAIVLNAESQDTLADKQDAPHHHEELHAPNPEAAYQRGPRLDMNRVLIVEDTVELAEVMQATLERMGLTATIATTGKAGMKQLKDAHPGLLLMDLGLPDTSGWKMLEDVKAYCADTQTPLPKVVIVTAYDDAPNRVIGKLQNIHSYLIKPVTPAQVEQAVSDVLGV